MLVVVVVHLAMDVQWRQRGREKDGGIGLCRHARQILDWPPWCSRSSITSSDIQTCDFLIKVPHRRCTLITYRLPLGLVLEGGMWWALQKSKHKGTIWGVGLIIIISWVAFWENSPGCFLFYFIFCPLPQSSRPPLRKNACWPQSDESVGAADRILTVTTTNQCVLISGRHLVSNSAVYWFSDSSAVASHSQSSTEAPVSFLEWPSRQQRSLLLCGTLASIKSGCVSLESGGEMAWWDFVARWWPKAAQWSVVATKGWGQRGKG